jgi:hypothetical protein
MPFKSNVILNGTITADLYLSLSAPDADIMLSWWEKDAEGKLWPLSQTVQRLSYCFDKSRRILWEKDKIYHVTLNNAYWMAKQMKKGSRLIMTVFSKFNKIITVEDGTIVGGFGGAVLEFMNAHQYKAEVKMLGIPDEIIEHGTLKELHHECGYDANAIAETCRLMMMKDRNAVVA